MDEATGIVHARRQAGQSAATTSHVRRLLSWGLYVLSVKPHMAIHAYLRAVYD